MTLPLMFRTTMRFQMKLQRKLTTHQHRCLEKVQQSHLAIEEEHWMRTTHCKRRAK
jgi:hypothetical protein